MPGSRSHDILRVSGMSSVDGSKGDTPHKTTGTARNASIVHCNHIIIIIINGRVSSAAIESIATSVLLIRSLGKGLGHKMCRQEGQQQTRTTSAPPNDNNNENNRNKKATSDQCASPLQDTGPPAWPGDTASSWQKWTYSYMGNILSQSFARGTLSCDDANDMSHQDIYAVPDRLQSSQLVQTFWQLYSQQLTHHAPERALFWTLWKLAAPTFVPAGVCQFISILCQVAIPLLVRRLLQQVERHPTSSVGLWPCFGIFAALLIYGLTNHRQRHLAMQAGITLRATVLAVLYQHMLHLTVAGRMGMTSGQITNLCAVDTQKLYEVAQEGHLLWALPLAIVLVTICLVIILGPVTLVGIGVLVSLVPLVQRITTTMHRLRNKRVACTDQRIALTQAFLQGVQVAKLNHYERHYEASVGEVRNQEMYWLTRETAVWATTLSVSKLSAAFSAAATFAVYVLMDESHVLTAATSFSVFLLFAALRFPINYAGRLIGRLAQAQSSLHRLALFLQRPARPGEDETPDNHKMTGPPVVVEQGSFVIGDSIHTLVDSDESASIKHDGNNDDSRNNKAFVVSGFDFVVEKGEVLACLGMVGSGKSTLLQGILGEATVASSATRVSTQGSVAFVPQTPFILNDTVRENILLGRSYDPIAYRQVIDACCLGPDIAGLGPARDLTEIGERGVTLSGGQKQRLSLARAAYAKPDLILLDDPLSALDAGTAKLVFQNLIKGPDAFLSDSAIILVTHASHFLNRVDRITVIVEGQNKFLGTWNELLAFEACDEATKRTVDHIRKSIQEDNHKEDKDKEVNKPSRSSEAETKDVLMTKEEREHGLSSWTTWLLWFKYAGGLHFASIMVVLLTLDRVLYFGQEYWVARWCDGAYEPISVFGISFAPQTDGRSAQYMYLAAYSVILAAALLANLARSEWSVTGGSRTARNVFQAMLSRALRAPMCYFETTPMGRLLNRFTYDMEVVDFVLSQNMSLLLVATSSYLSGISVMIGILPLVAVSVVPVTIIYAFLMWYYRRTGTDLQRLDALSRSPIQAMMTEGMDGVTTIRVLKRESTFLERYHRVVDKSTSALLNFVSAQRWLGCRIEMMGAITVFIPALLVSCWNDHLKLSSGLVGLLIVGSLNFTLALSFLVDYFAETESSITAIERVDAMSKVPQEKAWESDPNLALDPFWPSSGRLQFQNVCMRYRPGLPLALNGLSFEIPPGKTCGVVGRTGAGKSSCASAIFRLVEIESGRILLDGVDLGTLGLSDVRGRVHGMSIIPQDPFLAGSTIRECLDPFRQSNDRAILDALEAVQLRQPGASALAFELDTPIEEGGSNFSVGERQLLNLARALLSQPRLLVLDEATASIDGATDATIQHMLRTRFPGTTLLTIAHRLQTIMDSDFVLVMSEGKAAEFGPPSQLLDIPTGLFSELVDATGPESSQALRAMARAGSKSSAI